MSTSAGSATGVTDEARWFRVDGSEVRFLRDAREAFPAMLEAIRGASREVLLEFYWITPDAVGSRFRDALAERAASGVSVRVIYDALGSVGMRGDWWRPLIAAGADVREYHALLAPERQFLERLVQRDHRKLLVVDGAIGFTGGINLSHEWLGVEDGGGGWRDDAIAARGDVAQEMRALFYRTWRRITREKPPADVRSLIPPRGARVYVLTGQRRRRRDIHREYLLRIRGARESIDIANAYFLPDHLMRQALYKAVAQGVRVRVLLPEVSDVPGVQFAVEGLWDRMMRQGIEIYAFPPPMLHAKTAVIDRRWVTIGSYNLDERRLRRNLEANLAVLDEAFARHVTASFERDLARAKRIEASTWERRPLVRRGAEWLALALRELW
jgi:cardiolipin synthase